MCIILGFYWILKSNSKYTSYLIQGYKWHYTRYSQLQGKTEGCLEKRGKFNTNVTGEPWPDTTHDQDDIFTLLWCVNVRLHGIEDSLRELGRLCVRCTEVEVEQRGKFKNAAFYRLHTYTLQLIPWFGLEHLWMDEPSTWESNILYRWENKTLSPGATSPWHVGYLHGLYEETFEYIIVVMHDSSTGQQRNASSFSFLSLIFILSSIGMKKYRRNHMLSNGGWAVRGVRKFIHDETALFYTPQTVSNGLKLREQTPTHSPQHLQLSLMTTAFRH